jgi:hypothetical protein
MSSRIENKCGFNGDLVPYMYGELAGETQTLFESHLLTCVDCTDEFAELADARFSVYQWHKLEFVPLASPVISIPYDRAEAAVVRGGLLNSFRELFAIRTPAMAISILAVVIGIAFAVVFLMPESDQRFADNVVVDDEMSTQPVADKPGPVVAVEPAAAIAAKIERPAAEPARNVVRAVRKNTSRQDPKKRITFAEENRSSSDAETRWQNFTAQRSDDLPVLTNYEDSDDRSLRLTDLIDDDGSQR